MKLPATTNSLSPGWAEPGWAISGRPLRVLLGVVLAVCAASGAAGLIWAGWLGPDRHLDFFGLWSFARFLRAGGAGAVYLPASLQAAEQKFAPGFAGFYPCPYPPSFLAATLWLGALPIGLAKALWSASGVAALLSATRLMFRERFRTLAMLTALAAPAAASCLTTGETGLFTSAFLIAGLAWLPAQPVLAGIAFGMLTLKPQFLILVPFVLLALGAWRAIFAAGVTAVALVLLSCLILPPELWRDWALSLTTYQSLVLQNQTNLAHLMTTMDAALLCLHAPSALAWAGQILADLMLAATVWRGFRGADYRRAVAVLLAATPLAAPHGFIYDTPELTVALLLAAERLHKISTPMLLLYGAIFLLPLGMAGHFAPFMIYAVPEALLVFVLARHA
jgi:multidrug transporter EmrE-like cation transporter